MLLIQFKFNEDDKDKVNVILTMFWSGEEPLRNCFVWGFESLCEDSTAFESGALRKALCLYFCHSNTKQQ